MLFSYENRIHLSVYLFSSGANKKFSTGLLFLPFSLTPHKYIIFWDNNTLLQQSTALLDVVIIIGTEVYFALKFVLVGGPLVGKNIFSRQSNVACCIKLCLYFSKNAEFNAYCLSIILGHLRQNIQLT
jgi:hypothetical protein